MRADYCPIGGEPCQSLCTEPCSIRKSVDSALVTQLVEVLEFCRFSLEPYDDIKPRDWKTDRENLRRAHQQIKAALTAAKEAGL